MGTARSSARLQLLYLIGYNNLIYFIKRLQINPVVYYPLHLPARNYMHLSNHCPYMDYSPVLTIDPLTDWNMFAGMVKSAIIDRMEYANQCQLLDCGGLT